VITSNGGQRQGAEAIAALGMGLGLACLTVFLLTGGAQTALAASAPTRALPAPTSAYTLYMPLTMRNFATELYPDDPYYDLQWAMEKIEAPRAWWISQGSSSVLVAVLDSGTDLDHPDLASKVRTDIDRDFINNDNNADDDHGHGTHTSGIAAAATDNGVGVAGMGWETMILPLKVLGSNGEGDSLILAQAIHYAADHGAAVINMSLAGPYPCPGYLQDEVDYAYGRGVLLVAAAGNHDKNNPNAETFPANCEHVLGVAATERNDSIADYSNYGSHVSVAAPGSEVYSTLMGGGYGYKWGTSMATAYVSGLAALVRAQHPSYTPDQVASAILDNADDLGTMGWDQYSGCGRINAHWTMSMGARGSSPLCLSGVGTWAAGDEGPSGGEEPPAEASFVPGEIIVRFRPGSMAQMVALRYGAEAEFIPTIQVWRLRVPPGREVEILARLRADPAVTQADLNYLVSAQ